MKKILFIALTFCSISTISVKVIAQTKVQANNLQYQISDSLEIIYNTRSNFQKEKDFFLTISTEIDKDKGNIVKFEGSGRILKVAVCSGEKQLGCTTSIHSYGEGYGAGSTTGIFYLDSPAYNAKFCLFTFFAEGFAEPVWSTTVERIKTTTTRQIPNNKIIKNPKLIKQLF
jgi:hypothetical protein